MPKILEANDPLGKSLHIGPHIFPGVWRYAMPREFLHLQFPDERRATCMNCPKSAYESYRKDYRCCTYHPRIPNYLIGLAWDEGSAQPAIQKIIDDGWVTPEGMNGTPQQWLDYLADVEHDRFGKSDKVLCPMLDKPTGLCRVHAFRNSVCSTFFCLKDHGELGDGFWGKVQTLGSQVETSLAQWSLRELGFDLDRYIKRFNRLAPKIKKLADPVTGGWLPEVQEELWGDWADRKVELFLATAQLISEHRDELWDIANSQEIMEASKFDQAMVRMVPKELEGQVDEGDWEEGGEMVFPRELWKRCFQSYQKLWDIKYGGYRLARKVAIRENAGESAEDQYYAKYPFCLEYRAGSRSKEVEWRRYLSQDEKSLLDQFTAGQTLDWRLISQVKHQTEMDVRRFLAEMVASRVLMKSSQ
ncbi:MAG: hypothetical protein ACOH5I_17275 [Oligoflexus sp.]